MTYEQTLSPVAITEENALQVALDAGLSLVEVEQSMAKGIALTEIAASAVRLRDQGLLRGLDECQVRLPLTLERIIQALSELKITVRLNLITREMEVLGLPAVFNTEGLAGSAHIILHDLLKRRYRCTKELVADLLGLVAGQNRYNPVLDYFKSLTWDERDRMLELFSILGLHEEDTLSMVLVMKWSLQCVAMALNSMEDAYGADGVLVLQGPQGIGKTTFARTMAVKPMFFKAGQYIDPRDKDTTRRLTSTWIAELGEVETSLRTDPERLKAFITAEKDEFRLPYARSDTVSARRTSLIATCNSQEFLTDPTGSRRFWTVPVEKIDLKALKEFDVDQYWAQMYQIFTEEGESCFRLTAEEQQLLAQRNAVHEKPLRAQAEVEDILAAAEEKKTRYQWRLATVTEFKAENPSLTHYSVNQIGRVLDRMGIPMERRRANGKQHRMRRLPMRKPYDSVST